MRKSWETLLRLCLGIAIGFLLVVGVGQINKNYFILPPATAQSIRPEYVADIVYQRLPDLPKNNQFTRKDTGKIDPDNTLVSRFIRYHQDVKKRPSIFRLDWRLTVADYLGANEPIKEERYPGKSTLTSNPMEADIQAIGSLNRRQRSTLVDVIVSTYNPKQETPNNNTPKPSPEPTPNPSPTPTPSKPSLSQPGDSELLLP